MIEQLCTKLDPRRFPNMSGQMAAILGFLLDREFTSPALAELIVTPDGAVLGRPDGEPTAKVFIGAEADLRANLCRLGMAAGLEDAEWTLLSETVNRKPGIGLNRGEAS